MDNLAINSKLEIQVANTPAGPEKEHLIKLIEDRVEEGQSRQEKDRPGRTSLWQTGDERDHSRGGT